MIMAEKEYYTIEEVAEKLRVSVETIRRAISEGELKTYRAGRQHRISREQLDEYLSRKQ